MPIWTVKANSLARVAVRLRPPLGPSDPGFDLIPPRFQRSIAHVTSPTGLTIDVPQGRKLFVFDRVFGPDVPQEGVWDYLSESVDAFVQGYNVSVLAYGQSGSGKSYTMGTSGPAEQNDPRLKGIAPRLLLIHPLPFERRPPPIDQPMLTSRARGQASSLVPPPPCSRS